MCEVEPFLEEACGFSLELFMTEAVDVNRKMEVQGGDHEVPKHQYIVINPDLTGIKPNKGLVKLGGEHL